MPDDRFLHKRIGHSDKVTLLNDLEFRVWTQYILSADDFGVMRASAVTLQADNDNLANRPAKLIQRCVEAFIGAGLLLTFEHQGRRYVFRPDWQKWQKIAYPRATNSPKPPAESLALCDEPTQRLFATHPGGAGKKRSERSEKIPETFSDDSPLMRASAPAKRLTANGQRLTAHGSEEGAGETAPAFHADVALRELQAAYPQHRVTYGARTEHAFIDALSIGPAWPAVYEAMRANLANHIDSHEWRKGMAPSLEKWLRDGLWRRTMDEAPPDQRGKAPAGEPWVCLHLETCSHRPMCDHKLRMPEKYPVRQGAAV